MTAEPIAIPNRDIANPTPKPHRRHTTRTVNLRRSLGLPSRRTILANIRRLISLATPQELHDGLSFYDGAHGLCRLLSHLGAPSTHHAAGVYAALSPLNTWQDNVTNLIDVFRASAGHISPSSLVVNTTSPNLIKALWIAQGHDPLSILRGRKVRSFYTSIADPSSIHQVPVDRHLARVAVGQHLDNAQLSRIVGSSYAYSEIETCYLQVGEEATVERDIGNRAASIVWFVQRRLDARQVPLPHSSDLTSLLSFSLLRCHLCDSPLHRHGKTPTNQRRWLCPSCRITLTSDKSRTSPGDNLGREFTDPRTGRICVYLSPSHPYANTGGWQYRYRYRVMSALSRRLHPAEHVDHVDRDLAHDDLPNLRVLLISDHMRYHADLRAGRRSTYIATIAEWDSMADDGQGRFVEYETPRELI